MRTHRNRVLNPSILHLSPWDPQPNETYPQKPIAKWETNSNFVKVKQVPKTPTLLKVDCRRRWGAQARLFLPPGLWTWEWPAVWAESESAYQTAWTICPACLTHPEGQGRTHGCRVQKGKVQRGKESISESYITLPSGKVWPKEYFRHWPGRLAIFSLTRSSD